ncbi:MAG: hypothetical protein AAFX99_36825, partial [Myxococcota bacterium]
ADETFEAFAERVQDGLTHKLLDLFEHYEFNQVHIAEQMQISRTTLIRLMKRLNIPRPSDISEEMLKQLREQTGGDEERMAEQLGIPIRALRLFIRYNL